MNAIMRTVMHNNAFVERGQHALLHFTIADTFKSYMYVSRVHETKNQTNKRLHKPIITNKLMILNAIVCE